MSTFTTLHRASWYEHYAPTAFDGQIGKPIRLVDGKRLRVGVLLAAEVVDDGRAVLLTIESPDDDLETAP